MVKIISHYDDKSSVGITFIEPSKTQQHFKDDCDINVIVKRFNAGQIQDLPYNMTPELYADVSDIGAFQDARKKVDSVHDYFSSLPSSVREHFGNSVDSFVAFASDSNNLTGLINLGLLDKPAELITPSLSPTELPNQAEVSKPIPTPEKAD